MREVEGEEWRRRFSSRDAVRQREYSNRDNRKKIYGQTERRTDLEKSQERRVVMRGRGNVFEEFLQS